MVELSQEELQRRIEILKNQDFYKGASYFPELKSKTIEERFEDCVDQIKKYGWPDFNYMLYGMDVKLKEERNNYVNAMEFVWRRNYLNFERNHFNSCCLLRDKFYFGIYASAIGIKTPKNIAYSENGALCSIEHGFKKILLTDILGNHSDMFCKSMDGENGVGVYHIQVINDKIFLNGKESSLQDIESILSNGTYLLQERITQHPKMNELYNSSVNTLRIDTVRSLKTGEINVWPSMLRMGVNGSHIDNASQGGIMINIDLKDGSLNNYGYREHQFGGGIFFSHPDTNVVFKSFSIPYFKEAVQQCVFFHSMLKDIHSIGWDVVITPDGPAFIEGNDDWEILDAQLGGGVRDLFERDFFE